MAMFQISRRADYAVRIMVELGARPMGEYVPAREVSRLTNVSKTFLHKIAVDLSRGGLIRTQAGPAGGLTLARSAQKINLLQILETVEGPLCLNSCLLRPEECPRDLTCPAHGFWARMQTMLAKELSSTILDQLVAEAAALKEQPRSRAHIPYLSLRVNQPGLPVREGDPE